MTKMESLFTAILWLGATILLPMAALAPVDGAQSRASSFGQNRACANLVVANLRTCSAPTL